MTRTPFTYLLTLPVAASKLNIVHILVDDLGYGDQDGAVRFGRPEYAGADAEERRGRHLRQTDQVIDQTTRSQLEATR